ncbi:MAG: hypothetical protein WC712_03560 [Candidatus Brocadiia bacterium]
MRMLSFTISLLLLLAASTVSFGEVVYTHIEQASPLCYSYEMDAGFDCEPYGGSEEFDMSSKRLAAFATGWRSWPGAPTLREDDVLCYLPAKLDNPFKYVFFDRGRGDSRFRIVGRLIYRDDKLFGLSLPGKDPDSVIDLLDLSLLRYLYIGEAVPEEILDRLAKGCTGLKYICLTPKQAPCLRKFLKACPIEYYHVCGSQCRLWSAQFLYERNVPVSVEDISPPHEYLPDFDVPSLKYLTINENGFSYDSATLRYPNLEGLIIGYSSSPEDLYRFIVSRASKLRILVVAPEGLPKMPLPDGILASDKLEHLHAHGMSIANPAYAIASPLLRSLSMDEDSKSLIPRVKSQAIEYLSLRNLNSSLDIEVFPALKVLSVMSVGLFAAGGKRPSLRSLIVREAECTLTSLVTMMSCVPGGTCEIESLKVKGLFPAEGTGLEMPAELKILCIRSTAKDLPAALKGLIDAIRGCPDASLCCVDSDSDETIAQARGSDAVKLFIGKRFLLNKRKGIELRLPDGVDRIFNSMTLGRNGMMHSPIVEADYIASRLVEIVKVQGKRW